MKSHIMTNAVFFLLGNSLASSFLYADVSKHSVCSIFIGGVSRKNNWYEIVDVFIQERVWFENSPSQSEGGGMGRGRVRVEKQAVEGKDPQVEASSMYVREKQCCVGVRKGSHLMVEIKLVFQVAVSFL
jgi:hypothetical protein